MSMARYYFDTNNGTTTIPDKVGLELDGLEAARMAAVSALPDMVKDTLWSGTPPRCVVWARDEGGQCLLAVTLTLRVEVL